ncbi:inositol monophosphatase family protein [Shouchella lehensis]|nr:inositol monophosphatase family protein [Shouchella lehensis]
MSDYHQLKMYSFLHQSICWSFPFDTICFSYEELPAKMHDSLWLISLEPYEKKQANSAYSLSIAIIENKVLTQGFVYDNLSNNFYYAEKGRGAFLNGQPLCRDELMRLREAEIRMDSSFLRREQPLNPSYQRVRMAELPTALEICTVAEGNTDIFMTMNQTPYEFAAASLIAKEAGVEVMTLEGQELRWNKASSVWCGVV